MPNAVRSRGGTGNRAPGPVDENAARASGFHFNNKKSLRFDSPTSESVLGPALSSVGTFTNVITMAIWHKWDPVAVISLYDSVCGAGDSFAVAAEGPGMYWQDINSMHFHINGYNTNFAQADGLTSTDWNFFVGVYDGNLGSNNVKIYANGVLGATTDAYTGNINTDNNVEVGKTWNDLSGGGATHFCEGHCDEFAIWDSALTQDEITELYQAGVAGYVLNFDNGLYQSADNLRLWWRLGDQLDTDGADGIQDQSGNQNHGTLTDITSANFEEDVAGGGV
jgi:hypothetical protein